MTRRIKWRSARSHFAYEVAELAETVGVCRATVRNWIKNGLPVITDERPILISGEDFKRWQQRRIKSRKQPCRPGELYCFKCRRPQPPALGMVDFIPGNSHTGSLSALCAACEGPMFRACRPDRIGQTMPDVHVSIRERGAETKR